MTGPEEVSLSEPVATVVLNTYQQARYAGPALRSLLDQECEPVVILASDDGSTDGTYEAMERVAEGYSGPHRLVLRRNATNQASDHVPALLGMVTTPFIVRAHGDDLSKPHRVARLLEVWRKTGAPLLGSNADQIDADGCPMDLYHRGPRSTLDARTLITNGFRPEFVGAATAYERRLVEAPFSIPDKKDVFGGLDVILPIRACLVGQPLYVDEPLIAYRRHAGQASWQITDGTRDRVAFDEGLRALNFAYRLQTVRDIQALYKADPKRKDLPPLHSLALEAILAELQLWSRLRVDLMNRGMRPSWITREESILRNVERNERKAG